MSDNIKKDNNNLQVSVPKEMDLRYRSKVCANLEMKKREKGEKENYQNNTCMINELVSGDTYYPVLDYEIGHETANWQETFRPVIFGDVELKPDEFKIFNDDKNNLKNLFPPSEHVFFYDTKSKVKDNEWNYVLRNFTHGYSSDTGISINPYDTVGVYKIEPIFLPKGSTVYATFGLSDCFKTAWEIQNNFHAYIDTLLDPVLKFFQINASQYKTMTLAMKLYEYVEKLVYENECSVAEASGMEKPVFKKKELKELSVSYNEENFKSFRNMIEKSPVIFYKSKFTTYEGKKLALANVDAGRSNKDPIDIYGAYNGSNTYKLVCLNREIDHANYTKIIGYILSVSNSADGPESDKQKEYRLKIMTKVATAFYILGVTNRINLTMRHLITTINNENFIKETFDKNNKIREVSKYAMVVSTLNDYVKQAKSIFANALIMDNYLTKGFGDTFVLPNHRNL